MKSINLLTHCKSAVPLDEKELEIFNRTECDYIPDNLRKEEYNDLESLISYLDCDQFELYDYFYFNYSIPHIGKEFDLLRIGKDDALNIELKSIKGLDEITRQLVQNEMYLSFLERKVYCFTYVVKTNKLYILENSQLKETSREVLLECIRKQKNCFKGDLDQLFTPDHYLISPLNDPVKFMNHQYFLTQEQYGRKIEILDYLKEKDDSVIILTGSGGSGKTLLIYDVCKELEDYCILEADELNEGQVILKENYDFQIYTLDNYNSLDLSSIKYMIIDESEKMETNTLEYLIEQCSKLDIRLLIAYDPMYHISFNSGSKGIEELLQERKSVNVVLKGKIRGSKEVNHFIEKCFDLTSHVTYHYKHIHIYHFENDALVKGQISHLVLNDHYTYISLEEMDKVNGKEFNKVVVVLNDSFYYNESGKLEIINQDESQRLGMLYEAMNRAKTHLCLIVINNPKLYKILLHILSYY